MSEMQKVRATFKDVDGNDVTAVMMTSGDALFNYDPNGARALTGEVYMEHKGIVVEQVLSVPSKFGAVIRRADGMLFARREHEQGYVWLALDGSNVSTYDSIATDGGFKIEFDGVDE